MSNDPKTTTKAAIQAALRAAVDADQEANGISPNDLDAAQDTPRVAAVIAAFLGALPSRFPMERPGGQTWGHAAGEMAKLARLVKETAHGRHA